MAAHEHRLFRVKDGKLFADIEEFVEWSDLDEEEWPDDPDDWGRDQ
jgi:hypothetical protein